MRLDHWWMCYFFKMFAVKLCIQIRDRKIAYIIFFPKVLTNLHICTPIYHHRQNSLRFIIWFEFRVYKTWKPKSSYWYLRNQWYFNICVVLYSLYYIFLLCILRVYNVIKYWLYLRYFDDKKKTQLLCLSLMQSHKKKYLRVKKMCWKH